MRLKPSHLVQCIWAFIFLPSKCTTTFATNLFSSWSRLFPYSYFMASLLSRPRLVWANPSAWIGQTFCEFSVYITGFILSCLTPLAITIFSTSTMDRLRPTWCVWKSWWANRIVSYTAHQPNRYSNQFVTTEHMFSSIISTSSLETDYLSQLKTSINQFDIDYELPPQTKSKMNGISKI